MGNADFVSQFTDQIRGLHEIDYGDFKRKVVLYVRRLYQNLDADQKRSVQDLLQQMNNSVLYGGSAQIEKSRAQVLDLAEQIRGRLRQRH